jgi:integrase
MSAYRNARNGQWYFKCDAPRPRGGKRRQLNRGPFRTKRKALAAERAALLEEEKRLALEPGGQVTLTAYLRTWVARRSAVKPATVQSYTNIIEAHIAANPVGAKALIHVTRRDIDDLLDCIAAKPGRAKGSLMSSKTQANIHRFLKTAFAHAVERRLIAGSPMPPKPPVGATTAPVVKAWSVQEMRSFLAHVCAQTDHEWRSDLYKLALLTGCRRGELLALRWRHIDLERCTLKVEINRVSVAYKVLEEAPKTRLSRRTLHLQPQALVVVNSLIARQMEMRSQFPGWNPADYVFTTPTGEPWHPDAIRQRFEADILKVPKVTKISFHGLRHTYATLAMANGENPKAVSQRLGHSSVAFTLSQYAHVMADHDAQSADRVAAAMFGDHQHEGDLVDEVDSHDGDSEEL